jgi:hypothetical protein
VFLKTFGRTLETDVERFFELAMSFKITKQMCKDLEAFQMAGKTADDIELN